MLTADPHSPLIPEAVRWLMGNRTGSGWQFTRATAEAVITLAQVLGQTHELQPDFTARVTLDGKVIKEATWSRASALDAPVTVTIRPMDLRGHRSLTVERNGSGMLYVSAASAYLIPCARAKKVRRGIAVVRHYQISRQRTPRMPD